MKSYVYKKNRFKIGRDDDGQTVRHRRKRSVIIVREGPCLTFIHRFQLIFFAFNEHIYIENKGTNY